MLKKTMVICILLLIFILNMTIVKGNVFDGEYNNETVESSHYRNFSFGGNKGDDIQFNIKSSIPVNCYIIISPYKSKFPSGGEAENKSDDYFKNAELTKEYQTKFDFKWTIPANQRSFLLVVYNPNDENATVSIKHNTPVYDSMRWACCFLILAPIVIFTIVFFVNNKRKRKKQFRNPPPPL